MSDEDRLTEIRRRLESVTGQWVLRFEPVYDVSAATMGADDRQRRRAAFADFQNHVIQDIRWLLDQAME